MTTVHETLFTRDGNSDVTLRPWQPGDGLHCSFSARASRQQPCGRPVAVKTTSWMGRTPTKKLIVCMYHVHRLAIAPGKIVGEVERAARERVLVDHWDEYQALVAELTDKAIAAALGDLPEEFRELIKQGLANHPDDDDPED